MHAERAALFAGALLLGLFANEASAQQQRLPVEVTVDGLFGADVVRPRSWVPIQVTLSNRTERPFQGELELSVGTWQNESLVHHTRVDLPGGARRRVVIDVHIPGDGSEVKARYRSGGGILGRNEYTSPWSSGAGGVVFLARESRLRSVLGAVEASHTDEYGSTREVRMPLGSLAFDTATGDPIAPETALGWTPVELLVAGTTELEALSPPQRQALHSWIASGGRLLIFPRTPEAPRQPFVRSLVGEVALADREPVAGRLQAVPREMLAKGWAPTDRAGWVDEAFGGSRRVGFGRVYLATYDGTGSPHVDAPETRAVVEGLATRGAVAADAPLFEFAGPEAPNFGWMGTDGFDELRAALDPNESFRPALGFVALLLLLYVVVVGPLNFRWIASRNRPILALVTTPLMALGCLFLMLAVGYIGKGVTMRYRSVEMVETVADQSLGTSRGYLGLFLTRPSSFTFAGAAGLRLMDVGSPRMPRVASDGVDRRLEDLQGGLWQTLFLRRDRVRDLGGGVSFGVDNARLTEVRNGSALRLSHAIVIAPGGLVYPVGDLGAGATAPIGGESVATLAQGQFFSDSSPELRSLARLLGVETDEGRKALHGLVQMSGGSVSSYVPLLLARIDESEGQVAGVFDEESSLHLLRVVVPPEGSPLVLAPKYGGHEAPEPGAVGEDASMEDILEGLGDVTEEESP